MLALLVRPTLLRNRAASQQPKNLGRSIPMQHIPLSVRIRALFSRDKEAFWWNHFTDEEMKLRRMDVWGLAKIINEARVRNLAGEAEKLIVAEHMLNVRLARIQATASWGSGVLGFAGATIGAALSIALTMALQSPKDDPCMPEHSVERQAVVAPILKPREPGTQPLENTPTNAVRIIPSTPGSVNGQRPAAESKQPNATIKP